MSVDLEEMRDRLADASAEWKQTYDEGDKDVLALAGDPFDEKTKQAWDKAGRNLITCDELNQYVNDEVNEFRRRPRGIKVTPKSRQATDQTAADRAAAMRGVEYDGGAQEAYIIAGTNMIERGFGFVGVSKEYIRGSRRSRITFRSFPNPKVVLVDPRITKPTGADMLYAFVQETMTLKEFKRKYPKSRAAGMQNGFDATGIFGVTTTGSWFSEKTVTVAEYWTVEPAYEELHYITKTDDTEVDLLDSDLKRQNLKIDGGIVYFVNGEIQMPWGKRTGGRREESRVVRQYITNGFEVLGEGTGTPWDSKYIPIGCMFGKQMYVRRGGVDRREIFSMIRLARDPYLMYCYLRSTEAELIGMTPKTPYIGYTGQFATRKNEWENLNSVPVPYIEADPFNEGAIQPDGTKILLPLPQRQEYNPPIQAFEVAAESWRRMIQAATGRSFLPTDAQRINNKSGIALQQIQDSADRGSYHFQHSYDQTIAHTGRIVSELMDAEYASARDIPAVTDDRKHVILPINKPGAVDPRDKTEKTITLGSSDDHDIIVSAGKSFDSERDEAKEILGQVATPEMILAALQNPKAAEVIGKTLRLANAGPIVDDIANVFDPAEKDSPAAKLAQVSQIAEQQQMELKLAQEAISKLIERLGKAEDVVLKQDLANKGRVEVEWVNIIGKLITEEMRAANQESAQILDGKLAVVQQAIDGLRTEQAARVQQATEPSADPS